MGNCAGRENALGAFRGVRTHRTWLLGNIRSWSQREPTVGTRESPVRDPVSAFWTCKKSHHGWGLKIFWRYYPSYQQAEPSECTKNYRYPLQCREHNQQCGASAVATPELDMCCMAQNKSGNEKYWCGHDAVNSCRHEQPTGAQNHTNNSLRRNRGRLNRRLRCIDRPCECANWKSARRAGRSLIRHLLATLWTGHQRHFRMCVLRYYPPRRMPPANRQGVWKATPCNFCYNPFRPAPALQAAG